GGVCYKGTLFPPEYRGDLFFCEWGKSVVRYRPERLGSSFAKMKEHEFASGAANDPYPFKPTDLIVDHDGALIVVDWADGQRPKRGRGRIYRITPKKVEASALNHSDMVRALMRLIWDFALKRGTARELVDIARSDRDPRIQVQALRAAID